MINVYNVSQYCKDDLSLIENYEEAVNSPEMWDCHHRLEIELNLSPKELKDRDLYFNRPASELIFLTHGEHSKLHNLNLRLETRRKRSDSLKGENNPMYDKTPWNKGLKGVQEPWNKGLPKESQHMYGENLKDHMTPEAYKEHNRNISKANKGKTPWNKGLKGAQKSHNKGKKRHTREDGTHYYA
jgi:hypothetical protein